MQVLSKQPFNVEVLKLTGQNTQSLKPVTVTDIYEGGTNNFHEDGLYSTSIFGPSGSEDRGKRFSYIDLKLGIIHPLLFTHLSRLKGLYKDIIAGKKYAKWDNKLKDLVAATEEDGETGFAFFITHFKNIKFKKNNSDQRNLRISVIEKYREELLTTKWLVIPAGLREINVEDGRVQEEEIADLYRKVISISNAITLIGGNANDPVFDRPRYSLQLAINAVYEYIENMLTGKKGFIQAKWGSRRIFNGTRNVISSLDTGTDDLESPRSIDATDTVVGLYQTAKGVLPLSSYWLMNGHLKKIFQGTDTIPLVDRKSKKTIWVNVSSETLERWTTTEGIQKFINYYGNATIRHKPIMVEGKFLAMIYKDDVGFRILNPGEYDRLVPSVKEKCQPITHAELLYIAGYDKWNTLACIITRYPITGLGSTYPSTVYVKTTVEADPKFELNEMFEPISEEHQALEFPRYGVPFFDTIGVNPNRITQGPGLGADFDGDTVSCNFLTSMEAIKEIHDLFERPQGYMDPRGGFQMYGIDTIDWLLRGLTHRVTKG